VARHARRVIQIKDGAIALDDAKTARAEAPEAALT
jgi:hypothetical protein